MEIKINKEIRAYRETLFSACPCGNLSAPFWRWALPWRCISL